MTTKTGCYLREYFYCEVKRIAGKRVSIAKQQRRQNLCSSRGHDKKSSFQFHLVHAQFTHLTVFTMQQCAQYSFLPAITRNNTGNSAKKISGALFDMCYECLP